MKPFLCIDITTDKHNEVFNGNEFLIDKPSKAIKDLMEKSFDDVDDLVEKTKLPSPLRIMQGITGIVGLIILVGILSAFADNETLTIRQSYQNAPELFWIGGICIFIWSILKVLSIIKEKNVLKIDDSDYIFSKAERAVERAYAEMNVPTDVEDVGVLFFYYKIKKNALKVSEKGVAAPYGNALFKVFRDEKNLYLCNLDGKFAFSLNEIRQIHTVNKKIRISGWNKEEGYKEGRYKSFKLFEDNYGCIVCKMYHIIEFTEKEETWGIYIPSYELPVFEKLIAINSNTKG